MVEPHLLCQFCAILGVPNCAFWWESGSETMLNRRGLKNHAECTSQNVKRTSGGRVMTNSCRYMCREWLILGLYVSRITNLDHILTICDHKWSIRKEVRSFSSPPVQKKPAQVWCKSRKYLARSVSGTWHSRQLVLSWWHSSTPRGSADDGKRLLGDGRFILMRKANAEEESEEEIGTVSWRIRGWRMTGSAV